MSQFGRNICDLNTRELCGDEEQKWRHNGCHIKSSLAQVCIWLGCSSSQKAVFAKDPGLLSSSLSASFPTDKIVLFAYPQHFAKDKVKGRYTAFPENTPFSNELRHDFSVAQCLQMDPEIWRGKTFGQTSPTLIPTARNQGHFHSTKSMNDLVVISALWRRSYEDERKRG